MIVKKYNFGDSNAIWDLPENAELKELRKDPQTLLPGDKVFIPDKEVKEVDAPCETLHRFVRKKDKLMVRIKVTDFDGEAVKDTDCQLYIESNFFNLKTDAEGMIEHEVPPDAASGKLVIPSLNLEIPLLIGHLDPEDEGSGWKERLINLGYYWGTVDDNDELRLRYALEEFQCDYGLKESGEFDNATKAKLEEIHGS